MCVLCVCTYVHPVHAVHYVCIFHTYCVQIPDPAQRRRASIAWSTSRSTSEGVMSLHHSPVMSNERVDTHRQGSTIQLGAVCGPCMWGVSVGAA